MGVPHLTKQLHAFAEFAPLGCKSEGCKEHPSGKKIIIDGPSLAYHIYHCGLAHSPSDLGPIDAIPSYDKLGKATVAFLDELQSYGTTVEHIFFDGAISKDREEIRILRLEACVKQLSFAHGTYLSGFEVSKETATIAPITAAETIDSTRTLTPSRKALPAPAFIVPAVLDALRVSGYASVTSVVPGEADLFCARAAFDPDRTIFTNDSDLLLYDLGASVEVVFLNGLEIKSSPSNCVILYAHVSQPSKIASRLGLRGLRRLAFEIREDKSINLRSAVMRAKQSVATLARGSPSTRRNAFKEFENEYDTSLSGFEAITRAGMTFGTDVSQGSFLDPRVSELVSQSPYPSSIFLPFLTDDRTRISAWDVSRELRYFAYSCLLFKNSDTSLEQVSEYLRRGSRIVEDDVRLLSCEETVEYATTLVERLERFKVFLADFSTQSIWRPYALCEVFGWYHDSGRKLPSKDTLTTVFSGTTKSEQLSWNEVHISAQLQAVLYSLRMLHQILSHLIGDAEEMIKADRMVRKGTLTEHAIRRASRLEFSYEHAKQLPYELLVLDELLRTLPLLGELIPSRLELTATPAMPAAEVEHLLDVLISSVQEDSDGGEQGNIASKEDGRVETTTATDDLDGESSEGKEPCVETDVIGVSKSEDGHDGQNGQASNNPFSILGSE
ncbi:hypothetical protein MMC22_002892 [Lobaria immixta]|nr:hypothetical protein [Lobaria immixta]